MTSPISKTTQDQMAVREGAEAVASEARDAAKSAASEVKKAADKVANVAVGAAGKAKEGAETGAIYALAGGLYAAKTVKEGAEYAAGKVKEGAEYVADKAKKGAEYAAGKAKAGAKIAEGLANDAVEIGGIVKDLAVEAAGELKGAVVDVAKAAKRDIYNPLTEKALEVLGTDGELIAVEDPTRKFSAIEEVDEKTTLKEKVQAGKEYVEAAESRTKKVKAALRVYDNLASTYGDKASLKAGRGGYYVTKLGLEVLTGSLISRSKIGRVVQEGLATAIGGLARLIVKVAEFALRLLPYIVATALVAGAVAIPVVTAIFACAGWAAFAGLGVAIGAYKLYQYMKEDDKQIPKLQASVESLQEKIEALSLSSEPVTTETAEDNVTTLDTAEFEVVLAELEAETSVETETPETETPQETQVVSRMPSKRTVGLTAAGIAGVAAYAINPIIALAIPVIMEATVF